jgi:AcrR family transcriptional regulator
MTSPPARADVVRNRRRILDAAAVELGRHPRATLDDLAAAAGLGRATLYRHFAGRDDLVEAVYLWALDTVGAALREAQLDHGDIQEAFDRALAAVLREEVAYRVLVRGPMPDLDPALEARFDATLEPVLALARRGIESGAVAPDLPAAWVADAWSALALFGLSRVAEEGRSAEEVAALVRRTFWRGARASG